MRVSAVVLGASGFIGTRLIRRLVEQGADVRAVDLEPPREILDGVRYERLDVRQPLPEWVGRGAEVLYNLAAIHRTPGHPPHEYYATNVQGAVNATALAAECRIPTIVFTSSIAVYGPTEEPISEAAPLQPTSDYGFSKKIAESVHRNWLRQAPQRRLVVVRPGVVFGPGERGNYTRLAGALRRGLFAYPGRKTTIKSGGHVDDLLAAIEFALARAEPDITFNYAYPQASTTEDIVRALAQVAGYSVRAPVVPARVIMAVARLSTVANLLGLPNPVHPERVRKLSQSTWIVPAWLKENGYAFGTDLNSGLELWGKETGGRFQ